MRSTHLNPSTQSWARQITMSLRPAWSTRWDPVSNIRLDNDKGTRFMLSPWLYTYAYVPTSTHTHTCVHTFAWTPAMYHTHTKKTGAIVKFSIYWALKAKLVNLAKASSGWEALVTHSCPFLTHFVCVWGGDAGDGVRGSSWSSPRVLLCTFWPSQICRWSHGICVLGTTVRTGI